MPDANGNFRGIGWSRRSDDAWDRVFGGLRAIGHVPTFDELPDDVKAHVDPAAVPHPETQQCCGDLGSGRPCEGCPAVPHEPPHEDPDDREHERADRDEAAGWGR